MLGRKLKTVMNGYKAEVSLHMQSSMLASSRSATSQKKMTGAIKFSEWLLENDFVLGTTLGDMYAKV